MYSQKFNKQNLGAKILKSSNGNYNRKTLSNIFFKDLTNNTKKYPIDNT